MDRIRTVAPFSKFQDRISVDFCINTGKGLSERFHFKANRRASVLLKDSTTDFQKDPPFGRLMFLCKNHWKFGNFQYFNFETKPFPKNWSNFFQLKVLRLKTQHFHTKLSCQKSVLILQTPTTQNDQTNSKNSSATAANCLSVFDHFVGLALKGLRQIKRGVQNEPITRNGILPATTLFL